MNGRLIPTSGEPPIPLLKEKISIGRQPDCDLRLPFPNVSSRHAELRFHKGWWILLDKKSSNGTRVNGDKIERKRLNSGDEVTFARKYSFRIEYTPEAPPPKRSDIDVILKKKSQKDEMDVFGESLLERAGLTKKQSDDEDIDPGLFFEDDEPPTSRQGLVDE